MKIHKIVVGTVLDSYTLSRVKFWGFVENAGLCENDFPEGWKPSENAIWLSQNPLRINESDMVKAAADAWGNSEIYYRATYEIETLDCSSNMAGNAMVCVMRK